MQTKIKKAEIAHVSHMTLINSYANQIGVALIQRTCSQLLTTYQVISMAYFWMRLPRMISQ